MAGIREGSLLWKPSPDVIENANLTHYMRWLAAERGLTFSSYRELWQWSVTDLSGFWQSIWDYFGVRASAPVSQVLADREMPGAQWFTGTRLNYAENILVRMKPAGAALLYQAEDEPLRAIGRDEVQSQVAQLARALQDLGIQAGDCVVAYLPNIPEAIVGLLACASLGAVWSSCSPDFGSRSVLDRFSQIEPRVLLAVDGYRYGGKRFNRLDAVRALQTSLPSLAKTILIPLLEEGEPDQLDNTLLWHDVLSATAGSSPLTFTQLPFDHPLWVLYSSGTTGLPKPIVHGHGGIILEHLKELILHMDLKPEDRFFWYTSTGWMMWNYLAGGLLSGGTLILYNGSPGYPDLNVLWRLAEESGMTYFGTSAAFIHACLKAGLRPNRQHDLSRIRALGSTGSPLSPEGFAWVYENVNQGLALESFSGGTDLCTGFVGGVRLQPIYAGEIQAPSLGAGVQAFNEVGEPVINQVGELVITEPMPSMPIYFWNDPDNRRYRESYFSDFAGVWRHGDWIKINERGGCVIYGRSDATINRQGIRMGTAEIYRVVESLPEVVDSLVIDLEGLGGESYMPLFVVLDEGLTLDDALKQRIRQKIRDDLSPRHTPDDILAVAEIPYTLSGKKMEVPVRKILTGSATADIANPGAMRNPTALDYFIRFAAARRPVNQG
jgi:acetoacetyl-CoA synthetase